jgi:hypothetical protein
MDVKYKNIPILNFSSTNMEIIEGSPAVGVGPSFWGCTGPSVQIWTAPIFVYIKKKSWSCLYVLSKTNKPSLYGIRNKHNNWKHKYIYIHMYIYIYVYHHHFLFSSQTLSPNFSNFHFLSNWIFHAFLHHYKHHPEKLFTWIKIRFYNNTCI